MCPAAFRAQQSTKDNDNRAWVCVSEVLARRKGTERSLLGSYYESHIKLTLKTMPPPLSVPTMQAAVISTYTVDPRLRKAKLWAPVAEVG